MRLMSVVVEMVEVFALQMYAPIRMWVIGSGELMNDGIYWVNACATISHTVILAEESLCEWSLKTTISRQFLDRSVNTNYNS